VTRRHTLTSTHTDACVSDGGHSAGAAAQCHRRAEKEKTGEGAEADVRRTGSFTYIYFGSFYLIESFYLIGPFYLIG
jgi:hypothetical protein